MDFAGPTDLVADCERRGEVSPALQALFAHDSVLDDRIRTQLREASPLTHLSAQSPPTLLIHGTKDENVLHSQSINFQARLYELGVPCELIGNPDGEHRLRDCQRLNPAYQQAVVDWLDRELDKQP